MKRIVLCLSWGISLLLSAFDASAQSEPLTFVTVERPPFSMHSESGTHTGFAIDLTEALAVELGRPVRFETVASFPELFAAVTEGRADGAVANISITAAREEIIDFSHPIYEGGLQIMLHGDDSAASLYAIIATRDVAFFLLSAFGCLFFFGLLMWYFEREHSPYFQRPFRQALFPSFWWALNLVVNGGFEERVPQSRVGRFFGVLLVVSSLFVVSVFVAKITAAMTIAAIAENVDSINDIEGRTVATTVGSTGEAYLITREVSHTAYTSLSEMLDAFESGSIDAIVFDGPVLSWYLQTRGDGEGRLVERVFKRENYGMVLPTGSPLTEQINRALLALRESGKHDEIQRKYFGN